jgi:putative ABC transport system substrate-binding protein
MLRQSRLIVALTLGLLAWLRPVEAQQPIPVIGYLSVGSPESDNIPSRLVAFRQGLSETGYVEGQNVAIEYRWAHGQYDRMPVLAADLARRPVSVIVAPGVPPALAAKAATATIPIVFNVGIDPVQSGLVASLNRPGGNVTGVAVLNAELTGKRLELLHEMAPAGAVVALLVNPTNRNLEPEVKAAQDSARSLGLELHILPASTASEIDAAFATLVAQRAGSVVVVGDPFFTSRRAQIVVLAGRHAVPAIYVWRQFTEAGGLMSYGADLADGYRQSSILTSKILKGAKPADLPVQQVVKLELIINLKTAKALGLAIPHTLSARADEVIE